MSTDVDSIASVSRRTYILKARDKCLKLGRRTRLMGVLNVTPDSFSDGGLFFDRSRAVDRCLELVEAGADILDLGGESSRPGAQPVSIQEEIQRVLPVLQEIRKKVSVLISVDTYKSAVAREALREGADIINDISAFRFDQELPDVIREYRAAAVLMHMRGTPQTMQELTPSSDILQEIQEDLQTAVSLALEKRLPGESIVLDPGIGFGKSVEDNCKIVNRLRFLHHFDLPILIGTSRKSFLGKILNQPVQKRAWGTAASVAISILRGAHILRVHDVAQMREVARVSDAIFEEGLVE